MSGFIAACARRPIAVTQVFIGLLLFGLVAAGRLPVTLLPDLAYPTVTVRAELPGAAPEEVETLLARPMEEALGAVRGLRRISSRAQIGRADVTLSYHWGTSMDTAVLDVRERLDALILPQEASRPVVLRFDPQADPIVRYGFARDDGRDDVEALKRLRRVAEDAVQRPLESTPGVAAVEIAGGLEREIVVVADVARLARFGLSLGDISARLAAENANISGGQVEQGTASYLVRTLNPFASLEEIADTILLRSGGNDVRVRDVAEVRDSFRERDTIFRVGGVEAVEIAIYKEGDANTVAVAEAATKALDAVAETLPEGFALTPLYDQSRFIRAAIDEVRIAALLGGLLAVTVLWLFLGRAWITAIIALTIPVAVISTFNIMAGAGVGLNVMSLGGIALAIGMLVDDAVVVLEAIARRREAGEAVFAATVNGTREVAGPVMASTATTVAVFLPLVFVEGVAGQLFTDQAIVVSGALVVSMLVALTLIPALAARGEATAADDAAPPARGAAFTGRLLRLPVWLLGVLFLPMAWLATMASASFQGAFEIVARGYARALQTAMQLRWLVLLLALLLGAGALALVPRLGLALVPPFAQGSFLVELTLPQGTPLARTDALAARVAAEVAALDGVADISGSAGVGTRLNLSADSGADFEAELSVRLQPGASEGLVRARIARVLGDLPELEYRFSAPTLFNFDAPLAVELVGFDLEAIAEAANRVEALMRADDQLTEITNSARRGQPELRVSFDEARAAALGLRTSDIAETVAAAVDGSIATRYRLADREIDIRVRGGDALREDLDALRALPINPQSAAPLPLSAVASVIETRGPSEIRRAEGSRVAVVTAQPLGDSLGDALSRLRPQLARLVLPPGVELRITGQSDDLDASLSSGLLALALAVFVVYLIMAAQFESLRQPFVILLTVPLAGIGAVVTLWATGSTLNVVALIGFIVLAGIVVKNGMVMVDLANRLRVNGHRRDAAIVQAAAIRLRPILITTLTTVLGLTPMLLGGDEGAELRRPLALTLIGGLSVSAVLTLFVIPVAYSLMESDRTRGGASA